MQEPTVQIKLVATGCCQDVADYIGSPHWQRDLPGFIIDRNGTIHGGQGEQNVIALENAGEVVKRGKLWVPVENPDWDVRRIVPYEYCSCSKAFEMMPDRQLKPLGLLLRSLLSQFHITFPYDNQLGRVCPRAVAGLSGIYFASSYDKDRFDIHPQVELIMLIKSLAQ